MRRRPQERGTEIARAVGSLVAVEITSVAPDEITWFDGERLQSRGGLLPGSVHSVGGVEVRTLDDIGETLSVVGTANDVHFGETVCGLIGGTDIGPVFRSAEGAEPYPEVMNRGAVAELEALDAAAVVVKGDLTGNGTLAEYERFLEVYGVFGDRLVHVRGNHDSYHGQVFADWSMQEVAIDGAVLAVLDTARLGQVNGSLSGDQLDWLDELASRTDETVLVFGHHHVWEPGVDPRADDFFGIVPDDSEALFEVFARRPNLLAYFAGHTHRNRRLRIGAAGGATFAEVACVKDFPGAIAEYRIGEQGVCQVMRRISAPDALAWSEPTRAMYDGGYGEYAFGTLADRCFVLTDRRG